jgi:hypothetical protein
MTLIRTPLPRVAILSDMTLQVALVALALTNPTSTRLSSIKIRIWAALKVIGKIPMARRGRALSKTHATLISRRRALSSILTKAQFRLCGRSAIFTCYNRNRACGQHPVQRSHLLRAVVCVGRLGRLPATKAISLEPRSA